MKSLIFFLLLLVAPAMVSAQNDVNALKAEADSAYVHDHFDRAAQLYLQIAQGGYDATLCYNLGCAYYRLDSLARSILWLERALLLAPDDADIRYNLALVRDKTIDRITPRSEMFFFTFWRSMVNMLSVHKWAILALTFFCLALMSLAIYFYSRRLLWRKCGFFAAIALFALCVLSNVCALQQRSYAQRRTRGVIVATAVNVKSTPSPSGNELFVIHHGTSFEIVDETMKEWAQIRIADGKVGWVEKKTFERI